MTGVGERVLVLLSAKSLFDHVTNGKTVEAAAQLDLQDLARLASASVGLIALNAAGNIVQLRDTPFMASAQRTSGVAPR